MWHADAEAGVGVLWPLDVHDGRALMLVIVVVLSVVAKDNPSGLEVAVRCRLTDWELLDTVLAESCCRQCWEELLRSAGRVRLQSVRSAGGEQACRVQVE